MGWRYAYDLLFREIRAYGSWVRHCIQNKKYGGVKITIKPTFGDAEIRWPAVILTILETAYVVQSSRVLKVRPVNGKLVICI